MADLHSEYGIDTGSGVLRRRSASWLRERIVGLMAADTRLHRVMHPPKTKGEPL